jgi:hypothetical protein
MIRKQASSRIIWYVPHGMKMFRTKKKDKVQIDRINMDSSKHFTKS